MITDKQYNPAEAENKWYPEWKASGIFHATPDSREAYTIVIPPPNVTGVLHMGHMLNNTIQDVLVRRARMLGKNACWVPGTDHASIATESKVVALLREEGLSKHALGRDAFLERAWEWKERYGGIILNQLERLGASCDWERTRFTMEPDLSKSVEKVFIDLYNKGYIYRGLRMVNWDPAGKTALSDEEVLFKETQGNLYYVKYAIKGTDTFLKVATTRPETILADTAICVHPEDERFAALIGKSAIVPLCGREVPVIADEYVDPTFGTGALKVTPAHDPNDYQLGEKHGLECLDMFEEDGTLNSIGGEFAGMDRFKARKAIAAALEAAGLLEKIEPITHQVGYSERSQAVVEPRLSLQWFVNMKKFMEDHPQVLESVMSDEISFHPPKFKNNYAYWLTNIKDWCISRQLWWGHRIPAWYGPDGKIWVAESIEAAWELAAANYVGMDISVLKQDEDVLDTWFSSWLWPFTVFDGLTKPGNPDYHYFYPTSDLVTGPDILFFWVARMVMAGYAFTGKAPFKNVYFTGIVRDKQGRKMSKSLGNSPDALELIDTYGADGVRVGLLLSSAAGNDLLFDESLCLQGRNFANKVWNARRLLAGWETDSTAEITDAQRIALNWYESRLNHTLSGLEELFSRFKISDALHVIYKLWWDDFCSTFLELVKPENGNRVSQEVYTRSLEFFDAGLRMLHPFMPFLTESLWQSLSQRDTGTFICTASWPAAGKTDSLLEAQFPLMLEIISAIRAHRQQEGLSPKETIPLYLGKNSAEWPKQFTCVLKRLANIEGPLVCDEIPAGTKSFLVKQWEFALPATEVNSQEALEDALKELSYHEGFLKSVVAKLSNERFVANAKAEIVENEQKKKADAESKIQALNERISVLKSQLG
jgi:valyl-tRNA synthetase